MVASPSPTSEVFLESYFNNEKEYNELFSKFDNTAKTHVLGVITSHHFLAKDLIAQTFSGIDPTEARTVIIISPDHFKQIIKPDVFVQTTNSKWHTPFGNIDPDNDLISKIVKESGIISEINLFRSEHGVYILVPFAKKALPYTKIVPLVLRQSINYQYFYDLGEKISKMVNLNETVLIISSDFTHYTSTEEAKLNDEKSIILLPNKKLEDIDSITNDCKQCTAFLFGYLKDINTDFELIFNKNSFDLSGQNLENVTSYVGAYFVAR